MTWIHTIGLLFAASDATEVSHKLNVYGWIVMVASVGSVLTLVSYCLFRVLTLPSVEQETVKGPLDIDTGDTFDAD